MNVCSVCGERTWNYEGGTRICMNGHKSGSATPEVVLPPFEERSRTPERLVFAGVWVFTVAAFVATELLGG